jgi:hypothetical protein
MKAQLAFSTLVGAILVLGLVLPAPACGQEAGDSGPAAALSSALVAACRGNDIQFARYLTSDNAAAFRALPGDQRASFLKRFSLTDKPGKPLISSDPQDHIVLHCGAEDETVEFRFGEPRVRENLAFVPVTAVNGQQAEFGLVREGREWRILSLGLLLLDIPQLSKQWAEEDITTREDSARAVLRGLADAIDTYHRAFGRWPESLAQLGPAPKGQISPEQASLVNERLAAGAQDGYRFRYRIVPTGGGSDGHFELTATPEEYGKSGHQSFFFDSSGKIHGADKHGAPATDTDPLLPDENRP